MENMLRIFAMLLLFLLMCITTSSGKGEQKKGTGIVTKYSAGTSGLESALGCHWKHKWTHVLKVFTMNCVICDSGSKAVLYHNGNPLATLDIQSCEDNYDVIISVTIPNQESQGQQMVMYEMTDGKCVGVTYPSLATFQCFKVSRGVWRFVQGYTNGWRRHRNNHLRWWRNKNPH